MTTLTIADTAKEIKDRLQDIAGSSYFDFEFKGENIKIRVSNHSARHLNNDNKTFSFCTNFVKHSDANPMNNEWIVDQDGYCDGLGQDIEDILDWELN